MAAFLNAQLRTVKPVIELSTIVCIGRTVSGAGAVPGSEANIWSLTWVCTGLFEDGVVIDNAIGVVVEAEINLQAGECVRRNGRQNLVIGRYRAGRRRFE